MSENKRKSPDTQDRDLKNPSPIGSQHNPVSSPRESKNPVAKELEEREKFQQQQEIGKAARAKRDKEPD